MGDPGRGSTRARASPKVGSATRASGEHGGRKKCGRRRIPSGTGGQKEGAGRISDRAGRDQEEEPHRPKRPAAARNAGGPRRTAAP